MRLNNFVLSSFAVLSVIGPVQAVEEDNRIYVAPDEVRCQMQNKKLYCTDTENKPLTGQIITFKNREVIRRYNVKDGYMEGLSKTYYNNGKLKTSQNYTKGVINGVMVEYNKDTGTVSSLTTYKDGIKEGRSSISSENGIINLTYEHDKLEGPANVMATPKTNLCAELKKHFPKYECATHNIYQLNFKENKLASGIYTHITFSDCSNQENCSKDIVYQTQNMPDIIITGINNNCLKLKENLSISECSVLADGKNPECDKSWLKEVQEEIKDYLRKCRCPKLYDGSYKEESEEYNTYKKHCMIQE